LSSLARETGIQLHKLTAKKVRIIQKARKGLRENRYVTFKGGADDCNISVNTFKKYIRGIEKHRPIIAS